MKRFRYQTAAGLVALLPAFLDRAIKGKFMNQLKIKTLRLVTVSVCLAPLALPAQITNRSALTRAAATRVVVAAPVLTRAPVVAAGRPAKVEVKLPQDLSRYHVLEQRAQVTHVATNLAVAATDQFHSDLAPGSTLMFMEKTPPAAITPNTPRATKPLFATYFVKALPPERPGGPNRTASGTLTMLADVPTTWDVSSNEYVARLSVMFLSDDLAPNNSLLPMAVEFRGNNVKSIEPRKIELRKAGVDGSEEIVVVCDQYRPHVEVTAYYQMTNTTRELVLQPLTASAMAQMIISRPMLFAALVGGVIGGLLRLFKASKWQPKRILHYLAEGVAVGLVTVTMLLSGLLHNQVAGMSAQPQLVLAFSLAAAAGSVGAHFLDSTINRLRGNRTR